MKKSNLIIIICVVVLCLVGWISLLTQTASDVSKYKEYISTADKWVEEGLYQRAIANYELAHKEKSSPEVLQKIDNTYKLRCKEAYDETIEEYVSFLSSAVNEYPANKQLVDSYVEQCNIDSDYKSMYDCLLNAINNGYNSEENQKMLLKAKYAHKEKNLVFSAIKQSIEGEYIVARNNKWNKYSIEDGYIYDQDYESIGLCNKDGVVVLTDADSRLINKDLMVMGIFKGKVTDAGLFSEGLIPAQINGRYSYYDEFSKEIFGDFEYAGTFQNGLAAVKNDKGWILVDNKGKIKSDVFDDIVTDYAGRYMSNELILAKAVNGSYGIYDSDLKLKNVLDCTDTDILTEDGIIAIKKGEKWGFVDISGKEIIKPQYEMARSFSNGLAAVCKDGMWGFIDINNNLVIECKYLDVGYMESNGLCPVRKGHPNTNDSGSNAEDTAEKETQSEEQKTTETKIEEKSENTKQEDKGTEKSDNIETEDLQNWTFLELELGIIGG